MCSYQEWERVARHVREAVDEGQVREFVADAVAGIEALVDELKGCGCTTENAEWARGPGRRSRTEWVV